MLYIASAGIDQRMMMAMEDGDEEMALMMAGAQEQSVNFKVKDFDFYNGK